MNDKKKRAAAAAAAVAMLAIGITAIALGLNGLKTTPSDSTPSVPSESTTLPTTMTTATETTTETTTTETSITTETTTEITTTETSTTTETTTETTATQASSSVGQAADLRLVNPWNAISEDEIEAQNLVYYGNDEYVDAKIVDALEAMLEAGSEYGLYVCSGYRTYDTQVYLYNNKVDRVMAAEGCSYEEALDIAATEVARPGTSEHHTGLAVDLLHDECWELEEYWEDSEAFDWLMENCADYGFILRYPKDSQSITGVIYEPWHYRYVGVEAAQAIMGSGITLEEYLQG